MNELEESEMLELITGAVKIYGSQKSLSEKMGISEQYLSDIINGRRGISQKVADFFERQRVIIYRDAEEPA